MTNTRPPGTRTGEAVDGCYAAPLLDCDGDLEAEHFVSRTLLEQLGKRFTVTGPHWAGDGRPSSPGTFHSHVLCARHNRALSPVDKTAGRFYGVMLRAVNGEQVGEHTFNGEDLERWATKLLVGAAMSGNLSTSDHQKLEVGTVPIEWLRFLFSERTVPENCGFHFVTNQIEGMEAATNLSWQVVPGPANSIAGVSLKVANFFQFVMTVLHPLDESPGVVTYRRPGGFVLGFPRELGHIRLSWPETRLRGSLILNIVRPSVGSAPPPHVAIPPARQLLRSRSHALNSAPVDAAGASDLVARLLGFLSNRDISPRDRRDAEAWLSLLTHANPTDTKS